MKSAREAMIRGGPASVERALLDAAPAIAAALRDPRWLPPPAPLSLGDEADGRAGDGGAAGGDRRRRRGEYAPPADEAEAYRALEAPVRRLRLAREACTALGIGRGRRGGVDETGEPAAVAANAANAAEDDDENDGGGVPLSLAARVYEASADAAAAMRCADGELLKALAGLCGSIYPALRRQEIEGQEEEEEEEAAAARARPLLLLAREGEMRAALVLFYACMPARPLPQNLAQCLSAEGLAPFWEAEVQGEEEQVGKARPTTTTKPPPPLPTTPHDRLLVRSALRGASAALSGDWVAFGRCYAAMPRVPRHVMARCLPRVRAQALRCMARCFAPSLPVAFAERSLGLCVSGNGGAGGRHGPLVALLEDAAREGCKGSASALAAREAARRARADAVWSSGGGGREDSWEERADAGGGGGASGEDDGDGFTELVFKPPPPPSLAASAATAAKK